MIQERHFTTIRETTIDIINEMFGKKFKDCPTEPLCLEPVAYHKTLDEISRKFFILRAMHLLVDPEASAEKIFRELAEQYTLRHLGCEAEFFLKMWLKKIKFNANQYYFLNTASCDQTIILAQVLCLEPCLFDREVLCRTNEDNWKAIQDYDTFCYLNREWEFCVCPAREMATEYDFVNCLLALYNTDSGIHNFISENKIYQRLKNYKDMLDWLFTDLDFDD